MNFDEQVKHVRGKLQLSQMAMAKLLGVTFSTINRWENGHTIPTMKVYLKFEELRKSNGIEFEVEK